MQRSLFGVPIPEGAVRATVKPVLGRGPSKPLWCGPIERDGVSVEETDIIVEVSENVSFWAYVDLQVKAKRIVQKDPSVWSFKVVVSFEDQAGVRTEGATSTEEVEFFRRGEQTTGQADQAMNRLLSVLEKMVVELPKSMHEQTAAYHEKLAAAGLRAIEETAKNAASAASEIVKSAAAPLQSVVDANNKALAREGDRYDSSIKLNMRMLETKKPEASIFDELGKLAPLVPLVKPLLN